MNTLTKQQQHALEQAMQYLEMLNDLDSGTVLDERMGNDAGLVSASLREAFVDYRHDAVRPLHACTYQEDCQINGISHTTRDPRCVGHLDEPGWDANGSPVARAPFSPVISHIGQDSAVACNDCNNLVYASTCAYIPGVMNPFRCKVCVDRLNGSPVEASPFNRVVGFTDAGDSIVSVDGCDIDTCDVCGGTDFVVGENGGHTVGRCCRPNRFA